MELIRFNEIITLKKTALGNSQSNLVIAFDIADRIKIAVDNIKTDVVKDMQKEYNCKVTNDVLATIFGYSLPQYNRYKALAKLDRAIIEPFMADKKETSKSTESLLKYANKKPVIDSNEEDKETEVKVKAKTFKVTVKDGKITVENFESLTKVEFTNLIEELKRLENTAK